MMMLEKIKPCKCGGEANFVQPVMSGYYWIYCNECHNEIHPTLSKEDAIEIWNSINET